MEEDQTLFSGLMGGGSLRHLNHCFATKYCCFPLTVDDHPYFTLSECSSGTSLTISVLQSAKQFPQVPVAPTGLLWVTTLGGINPEREIVKDR